MNGRVSDSAASSSSSSDDVEAPSIGELVELVAAYARQQTLDPIRGAGRWLAFGLIAVVSLTIGVVMLSLGTLRLLQAEVFGGATTWSFVPYLIVVALCLAVTAYTVSRINRDSLHEGRAR